MRWLLSRHEEKGIRKDYKNRFGTSQTIADLSLLCELKQQWKLTTCVKGQNYKRPSLSEYFWETDCCPCVCACFTAPERKKSLLALYPWANRFHPHHLEHLPKNLDRVQGEWACMYLKTANGCGDKRLSEPFANETLMKHATVYTVYTSFTWGFLTYRERETFFWERNEIIKQQSVKRVQCILVLVRIKTLRDVYMLCLVYEEQVLRRLLSLATYSTLLQDWFLSFFRRNTRWLL